MSILVINAGSSSLKFGLFDHQTLEQQASGLIDWTADPRLATLRFSMASGEVFQTHLEAPSHRAAVRRAWDWLRGKKIGEEMTSARVKAVGHRVVHGGTRFTDSVRLDREVKEQIAGLTELAPLHNPPALEAMGIADELLPGAPNVAVFDTAFFASLPRSAYVYPLPYQWHEEWGVRRFGFHGISHAFCAHRAAELLDKDPAKLRLIIFHLGNGCSATAIRSGSPVATTMGFTPLEGLMMGTRGGSLDPGILLYVLRHRGLNPDQLDRALNHESGILGVSGISSDFRQVEAAAAKGNERAQLALEIYTLRVRSTTGALAATLGGIDALVFTAGIGENSARLRAAACEGLEWMGLRLDAARNAACRPDADIAAAESPVRVLIVHTREDLMIAREARRLAFS